MPGEDPVVLARIDDLLVRSGQRQTGKQARVVAGNPAPFNRPCVRSPFACATCGAPQLAQFRRIVETVRRQVQPAMSDSLLAERRLRRFVPQQQLGRSFLKTPHEAELDGCDLGRRVLQLVKAV